MYSLFRVLERLIYKNKQWKESKLGARPKAHRGIKWEAEAIGHLGKHEKLRSEFDG